MRAEEQINQQYNVGNQKLAKRDFEAMLRLDGLQHRHEDRDISQRIHDKEEDDRGADDVAGGHDSLGAGAGARTGPHAKFWSLANQGTRLGCDDECIWLSFKLARRVMRCSVLSVQEQWLRSSSTVL